MIKKKSKSPPVDNLLVLNYAMDSSDQVFSHQIGVVRELSPFFKKIRVITASENSLDELPANVQVYSSNWQSDSNLCNIISFYKVLRSATKDFRNYCVFSHMTEVQSILTLPFSLFRDVPHFLWYAHQSKSIYLTINHLFLRGIITSTDGSCPIKSRKIHVIGQGIDENIFGSKLKKNPKNSRKLTAVHVGRIDESKQIQNIINHSMQSTRSKEFDKLILIGDPTKNNQDYLAEIETRNQQLIVSGKLSLIGKVPRTSLPEMLKNCDVFIHSFNGSLDKSLVEATMLGLPVVTNNTEYQKLFGTWTQSPTLKTFELGQELQSFLELRKVNSAVLFTEIARRRKIALNEHTLEQWISKLVAILKGAGK